MQKKDFNRWWQNFAAILPDVADWVKTTEKPELILDSWQKALADASYDDAMEMTMRIQSGEVDFPRWDWQFAPAAFKKVLADIRRAADAGPYNWSAYHSGRFRRSPEEQALIDADIERDRRNLYNGLFDSHQQLEAKRAKVCGHKPADPTVKAKKPELSPEAKKVLYQQPAPVVVTNSQPVMEEV